MGKHVTRRSILIILGVFSLLFAIVFSLRGVDRLRPEEVRRLEGLSPGEKAALLEDTRSGLSDYAQYGLVAVAVTCFVLAVRTKRAKNA